MPTNDYNPSFLESPDPTSGLQRRTGQQFLDIKQTVHERRTLEHNYDPDSFPPQPLHGIHRMGSAMGYRMDDAPTDRPTGKDKNGNPIAALLLTTDDEGRIWFKTGSEFYYYNDNNEWVKVDTTPIGFIQIWPSITPPDENPDYDSRLYLKCDGQELEVTKYPILHDLIGYTYGGSTANFKLPNFSGVGVVGTGILDFPTDGDPSGNPILTGREKGDIFHQGMGLYVEDQFQQFKGELGLKFAQGESMVTETDGIFRDFTPPGVSSLEVRRESSGGQRTPGFGIDLTGTYRGDDQELRFGDHVRSTNLVMDYYIKVQ